MLLYTARQAVPFFFFFFQAEDGIRDTSVTGVQTCALPIWPLIRDGRHTLIAAPTGSGKTLAAFLSAIDSLLRQGPVLPDATQVLYVSPLRALSDRKSVV